MNSYYVWFYENGQPVAVVVRADSFAEAEQQVNEDVFCISLI